jgi:hypothetical protein
MVDWTDRGRRKAKEAGRALCAADRFNESEWKGLGERVARPGRGRADATVSPTPVTLPPRRRGRALLDIHRGAACGARRGWGRGRSG